MHPVLKHRGFPWFSALLKQNLWLVIGKLPASQPREINWSQFRNQGNIYRHLKTHRAFSYENRERSLASTERSLMDTIQDALEFTERSLMDPQSVLSWTPFEMDWNSSWWLGEWMLCTQRTGYRSFLSSGVSWNSFSDRWQHGHPTQCSLQRPANQPTHS